MTAMGAFASAPVDVGVLVLATLIGFGLVRWAIEVHRDGGGTGEHRAPSSRARLVPVIPGASGEAPGTGDQPGWCPTWITGEDTLPAVPAFAPPLEPLPEVLPPPVPVTAQTAVAAALDAPVPVTVPPAVQPLQARVSATMDRAARLAQLRGEELLAGWATNVADASQSPDWEQREAVPGYVVGPLGHGGDVDAALDSMFSRAEAAVTRALTEPDPTGAAAAQIRDGAL
jgi:hypothetical protein